MITAIYVYQSTSLHFKTSDSGLALCRMPSGSAALAEGESAQWVEKGVYKIESSNTVEVTGDNTAFEAAENPTIKTNGPSIPPLASQQLGPLEVSALQSFFGITDAMGLDSA